MRADTAVKRVSPLLSRLTYAEQLKRFQHGNALGPLLRSQGAPALPDDCFFDLTRKCRMVLSDGETAFFLGHVLEGVTEGKVHPLHGVERGVRLLETAEAAGHEVGLKSYYELMKICREPDKDDVRRLLLDLFARIATKVRLASPRRERSADDAIASELCRMALKAVYRIRDPNCFLCEEGGRGVSEVLRILRVAEQVLRLPGKIHPRLCSAVYIGWSYAAVHHDPHSAQRAERYWQRAFAALHLTPPTQQSLAECVAHSGTFKRALRAYKEGMAAGCAVPSTALFNALLLAVVDRNSPEFDPSLASEHITAVLKLLSDSGLSPDTHTLGLAVAVLRRASLPREAMAMSDSMRERWGLLPTRGTLTGLIAVQMQYCVDKEGPHLEAAERCMLEIFERDLFKEPPLRSAHMPYVRLAQCYAVAGDVAKLDTLLDSFTTSVTTGRLPISCRHTPALRTAFSSAYVRAAHVANELSPTTDWGGPLNTPWHRPQPIDLPWKLDGFP